jgi:4-hydroxy-4-methyl-2-oxoglutarate aldolase
MSHVDLNQAREKLYSAVVADACDGCGLKQQSPVVALPPMTTAAVLVGRCRTSLWEDIDFEDPAPYELELKLVDSCRENDVLVCAAGGSTRSGIWGELLTTAASNRGCVGVVVDGAVRDVRQMKAMGFPAFARARSVYDSCHRQRIIEIDTRVEVGGVAIHSGDFIIADEDGIVIVPHEREQEVLQAAWEKVHAENVTRDAIRDGMGAAEAYETYGVL